ncbi:N-6 DNA methylase [Deinococcus sp. QL22]|uniref:N-6 DNA methylase n=1 Tax=Deinococcus sp. QL22 TaxID=2939437 RepID=UPI002016E0CD|nr:N-6 DNA methylase [Deinococcus sp. QL22]UQN10302.1 SAM-dependent methyltransferase [Deinococcus sp. QL22]UQN10436.1 SAM-dependent methyltransferase [Deinococcus sp. QL22]
MTSKLARSFQRDAGAEQSTRGFLGDPLKLPFARILQDVKQIRVSEAYRRMVTAGACALTGGQQEALYLDAIKGLSAHDLDVVVRSFRQLVVDMDDRPYMDLLGPLYMEINHKLDRDSGGEFFTPFALSCLLARLQVSPDAAHIFTPGEVLNCNEPTAGTGGMVLTFAEALADQGINPLHTRWVVQDISDRSCYGAFINTTLWGIPATVVCGNTLKVECLWSWQNVFWHAALPWPKPEETQAEDVRFGQVVTAMRGFLAGVA